LQVTNWPPRRIFGGSDVLRPSADRIAGPMPMNEYQATTLRKLSIEAYQPKLFEEDLTSTEAARRIETLKREIALANSF
jgi:Protein of unknown function (DUF3072)